MNAGTRWVYAVKVDLVMDGNNASRYVGPSTRLNDPASYVSSVAAKTWKRRTDAEAFIRKHAAELPTNARVVTLAV